MFFPAREFDGLTFILHRFIWVAIYPGFTLSIQLMKSRINITLIFTDSCFDNHYSIIIYYSEKNLGVFKNFIAITFGLVLVFIHTIIVLHLLLNTFPDIYDFVFIMNFFNGFLLRTTFMFMYKNGLILCNVNMIHNLRSEYTYPP